jgi:hypothetical protein
MLPIVLDIGDADGTMGFFKASPRYDVDRFIVHPFKKAVL